MNNKININDVCSLEWKGTILFGVYTNKLCDLESAIEIVEKRIELSKGNEILLLTDATNININKDAISYFAENTSLIKKTAVIVSKNAWIYNFMTFFLRNDFPVKYFTNIEEGVKWLEKQ